MGKPFDLLLVAFVVQYAGLVAERWFFFVEARHPQNIYISRHPDRRCV